MDILGYELARSLSESHAVTMLAWHGSPHAYPGQNIEFLATRRDLARSAIVSRGRQLMRNVGGELPAWLRSEMLPRFGALAGDWLEGHQARIAHVHIYDSILPVLAARSPTTRLILHAHDHAQLTGSASEVGERLALCAAIVACSDYLCSELQTRFPHLSDRMVSIPNSVPDHGVGDAHVPTHSITYVGRISPEKGIHVLVDAFNTVIQSVPDASLTIVGQLAVPGRRVLEPHSHDETFRSVRAFIGTSPRRYLMHIKSLLEETAAPRVAILDELDNDEARRLMSTSGIVVFPPIWHEPFGLPVLEAMASGRPVIGTRSGALPSIIVDQVTGVVVERGDVEALAANLVALLRDPERSRVMGKNSRQRYLDHFSWDAYVGMWRDLYSNLDDR